eukprot:snap_masked-scaffold_1-processed-gene-17.34-mRNA-1 protein AED:1.00 eAED:1.00 QI:0/0/0/0/1/1/3/0/80
MNKKFRQLYFYIKHKDFGESHYDLTDLREHEDKKVTLIQTQQFASTPFINTTKFVCPEEQINVELPQPTDEIHEKEIKII